jgi:hypothetical protein
MMQFNELVPILHAAVGPVILISGAGLLLLSITNRFGRILDRSRDLAATVRQSPPNERAGLLEQLGFLSRRARLVRLSILFAVFSVLLASTLVITLFLAALLKMDSVLASVALFMGCMGSLIISLILFLQDINLSLAALKLELRSVSDAPL